MGGMLARGVNHVKDVNAFVIHPVINKVGMRQAADAQGRVVSLRRDKHVRHEDGVVFHRALDVCQYAVATSL